MGLLAPVLAADPFDDRYYGSVPVLSASGARVTPESALTLPAFYACTTIISEDIAKAPLQMFEDLDEKGSRRASNHPIEDLLHHQPNDYQTALEFREMLTAWAQIRKFGIAELIQGPRGPVDQLIPLHPDLVREDSTSRTKRYLYNDPKLNGRERTLLADEVFVLRGKLGHSLLDYARDSIGRELATQQFQSFLFSRGAKFQGVVESAKLIPDPIRQGIRKGLAEYAIGGPRAGQPMLLEDGMTWKSVSMNATDAQLIESLKWGAREMCRWFRMPPHKIADLEDAHFTNIETQSIEYVTDTLLSWAVRWEQAIRRDLILAKGRFFARHNLDAYLRGETLARYQAYALAIGWGWLTRNEVREKENMNPLEGLNEPLSPLNMRVGKGAGSAPQPKALAALTQGTLKLIAAGAAERLVRREYAAMSKLADRTSGDAFRDGVEAFYGEHADHIARDLAIPRHVAARYCREQQSALLARGISAMDDWLEERVSALTDLAMDKPEVKAA